MGEDPSNIGLTCAKHAPKPHLGWSTVRPEFFVGKFVKKGFKTHHPHLPVEHMWVKVERVENGKLVGELNNVPVACTHMKYEDTVTVELPEIEAVFAGNKELRPQDVAEA